MVDCFLDFGQFPLYEPWESFNPYSAFNYQLVDALDALAAIYSEIGERLRLLLAH